MKRILLSLAALLLVGLMTSGAQADHRGRSYSGYRGGGYSCPSYGYRSYRPSYHYHSYRSYSPYDARHRHHYHDYGRHRHYHHGSGLGVHGRNFSIQLGF